MPVGYLHPLGWLCVHTSYPQVRIHRSSFMRLRVARKGDAAEVAFFNGLVEDR
jgi:hypothetical protein